jgi:hypothetical protein
VRVAAAAGLGFLTCVLWFDLMFDVQVRGHHEAVLPADLLDSIAAYYRRVTTAARPMNRLIALVMMLTLAVLVGEIVGDDVRSWVAWTSLALTAIGVGLAAARTVRDAVRLGTQADPVERQSSLARSVFRDHVVCIVVIVAALVLQIACA